MEFQKALLHATLRIGSWDQAHTIQEVGLDWNQHKQDKEEEKKTDRQRRKGKEKELTPPWQKGRRLLGYCCFGRKGC